MPVQIRPLPDFQSVIADARQQCEALSREAHRIAVRARQYDDLELSLRALIDLKMLGCKTVGDVEMIAPRLHTMPGKKKTAKEVREILAEVLR